MIYLENFKQLRLIIIFFSFLEYKEIKEKLAALEEDLLAMDADLIGSINKVSLNVLL